MISSRKEAVKKILNNKVLKKNKTKSDICFAPINIALIKYWGKSDERLNLAMTPSLSISSNYLGTNTQILLSEKDEVILNNSAVDKYFFNRVFEFINLWRFALNDKRKIKIVTNNDVPTASGLASSASGFASLTCALNDFFSLHLSEHKLSSLARLGSGSACRSVFRKSRFAIWDGNFAKHFVFKKSAKNFAKNMRIMIFVLDKKKKQYSSREAMKKTKNAWLKNKNNCYNKWLLRSKKDILNIQKAKTWQIFGSIVENNSLLMHEAIREIGIDYFNKKTRKVLDFVTNCRKNELFIYATIDAGANVSVIYQKQDESRLKKRIKDSKIQKKLDAKILDFQKK